MSTHNIFETASRKKFRFNYRGLITVEDLFDLNKTQINEIYQSLSASMKASEVTLLHIASDEDRDLLTKIEIVKFIFNEKVVQENAVLKAKETIAKKQRIMEAIVKKEGENLDNTPIEDLQIMLNDL